MEFEPVALGLLIVLWSVVLLQLWRKKPKKEEKKKEDEDGETDHYKALRNSSVTTIEKHPYISICEDVEIPYTSEMLADQLQDYGFVVIRLNDAERKNVSDMEKKLKTFMRGDTSTKTKTKVDDYTGYLKMPKYGLEKFEYRYQDNKEVIWPENPADFEGQAKKYFLFLHSTACFVLKLLAKHLKCNTNFFVDMVDSFPLEEGARAASSVRLMRFLNENIKQEIGIPDVYANLLTLVPASAIPGLQIYVESLQQWVNVEASAREGDIIVIPGSLLQLITNNYFKSALQRTVRQGNSERYSMLMDFFPRMDATIRIVDSPLVDPDFQDPDGNLALGHKLPCKVADLFENVDM